MFELKRSTKQGESFCQFTLQRGAPNRKERRCGMLADNQTARDWAIMTDCVTNLCFGDDALLFSTSLVQLQKMMCDFKQSTESVGFKIHPDKIQRRYDIKIVHLTTQIPRIQHGDHAELRFWHLDTIKGTRKNETIDSTQNASFHHPNEEKIQKETTSCRNDDAVEDKTNHRSSDKAKLLRVAVQTQIATKTVTFSS